MSSESSHRDATEQHGAGLLESKDDISTSNASWGDDQCSHAQNSPRQSDHYQGRGYSRGIQQGSYNNRSSYRRTNDNYSSSSPSYSSNYNRSQSRSGNYANDNSSSNNHESEGGSGAPSASYYSRGYREYRTSPSIRADGSERPERAVRPGYVPSAEAEAYLPPQRRQTVEVEAKNESELEWSEGDKKSESAAEKAELVENATENLEEPLGNLPAPSAPSAQDVVPVENLPKKLPSQIATAIDNTLSGILGDSGDQGGNADFRTRPMGRFATIIARDRDRNEAGSASSPSNYGYNSTYNTSYSQRRPASQQARTDECPKLRDCISSISKLRQELLVVNTKLEYIRFMKNLDGEQLNAVERDRISTEPELLKRMSRIYEKVDEMDRRLEDSTVLQQ